MKLKYLLCILLLPLTLLGVNTNQVDNLWIPAAGSARFSNGSPGAGKTFTSDASGFGTWTTPIYGNVFTSSNNTFIAGRTNTFSGVVIIDGVRYPIADGTTNQVMTFGGNGTLYASTISPTGSVQDARYVIKTGFSSGDQGVDGLLTVVSTATSASSTKGVWIKKDANSNTMLSLGGDNPIGADYDQITNNFTIAQDSGKTGFLYTFSRLDITKARTGEVYFRANSGTTVNLNLISGGITTIGTGNTGTLNNNHATFTSAGTNTLTGIRYPMADGASNSVLTTYGNGTTAFLAIPASGGGGDVFTSSNNTFVVNRTNTFNGTTFTSNLTVNSDLSILGNTTIGNAISDTVTMNAATMAIPNDWSVGSGAFFISNSTGNVGIGTIAPTDRLHVSSASVSGTSIKLANTDTGGVAYRIISTGSANTGGAGRLNIYNETYTTFPLMISSNSNVSIPDITSATNRSSFVVNNNVPAALNTFYTNGNLRSDVMAMVNLGSTIGGQAFVELWTGPTIAGCTNVQSSFVIGAGIALSERFTFNAMVAPNELMLLTNLSTAGGTATFVQGRLRN